MGQPSRWRCMSGSLAGRSCDRAGRASAGRRVGNDRRCGRGREENSCEDQRYPVDEGEVGEHRCKPVQLLDGAQYRLKGSIASKTCAERPLVGFDQTRLRNGIAAPHTTYCRRYELSSRPQKNFSTGSNGSERRDISVRNNSLIALIKVPWTPMFGIGNSTSQ
ncbi:MAG: hypothetical protein ACI81L_002453 [Verrucomicrobiales bacterium]